MFHASAEFEEDILEFHLEERLTFLEYRPTRPVKTIRKSTSAPELLCFEAAATSEMQVSDAQFAEECSSVASPWVAYTLILLGVTNPFDWSSIQCICFTSITCCSGLILYRTCFAVYKMPLQISIFNHFIESRNGIPLHVFSHALSAEKHFIEMTEK